MKLSHFKQIIETDLVIALKEQFEACYSVSLDLKKSAIPGMEIYFDQKYEIYTTFHVDTSIIETLWRDELLNEVLNDTDKETMLKLVKHPVSIKMVNEIFEQYDVVNEASKNRSGWNSMNVTEKINELFEDFKNLK